MGRSAIRARGTRSGSRGASGSRARRQRVQHHVSLHYRERCLGAVRFWISESVRRCVFALGVRGRSRAAPRRSRASGVFLEALSQWLTELHAFFLMLSRRFFSLTELSRCVPESLANAVHARLEFVSVLQKQLQCTRVRICSPVACTDVSAQRGRNRVPQKGEWSL